MSEWQVHCRQCGVSFKVFDWPAEPPRCGDCLVEHYMSEMYQRARQEPMGSLEWHIVHLHRQIHKLRMMVEPAPVSAD